MGKEFTQRRGSIKKDIRSSICKRVGKEWESLPLEECQNIYQLTQSLVKNTRCAVTAELCARVAILRRAFEMNNGLDYWKQVDATIDEVRSKGEYKKAKMARQKYNKDVDANHSYEEPLSEIQTEMDQLMIIEVHHLRNATNKEVDKGNEGRRRKKAKCEGNAAETDGTLGGDADNIQAPKGSELDGTEAGQSGALTGSDGN
ncbi:hypothetical protein K435DRAFT_812754 [Dendrothele bispora CBS 962.96]|uniref:Uncharacterized protein n=1 Tax=Dendrothele bispora (strain CBS 962.96) TaxID=1314807 RepID=A0A4S8KNC1_DENBC|nr:hypothetical protein K435DRAFT_812754 [Dendrothele bispora CBS 962.96]